MRPIVVPMLAAILVAACSAAPAASSQVPSPSGPVTASPTPGAPTSAPPSAPLPTPTPDPTPVPSAPANPPSGAWTALDWRDVGKLPLGPREITAYGWSGGYIAVEQTTGYDNDGNELPVTIRTSVSSDGSRWSTPNAIDTSGLKGNVEIESIVEGPSGLIAVAYPYGDTCGGPPSVVALWGSSDGRAWYRIAMPRAFVEGQVRTIRGGGAGFIATGTRADGSEGIWTSRSGDGWRSRPLPTVTSGTLAIDDAISFDQGFVVIGSVLGEGECGGPAHVRYATWFSPDGTSWTRSEVPGASKTPGAPLAVRRIGDTLLLTQTVDYEKPAHGWTSVDGRTWTPTGDVSKDLYWAAVSDGEHVVISREPGGSGPLILVGVDATGRSTDLAQSGDVPQATDEGPSLRIAVGPDGVLAVRSDGGASYLGVPS